MVEINVIWCLLVSLTITCLCCFCLKGFVIAIVKTKVYRNNKLRSQLVFRIELLQRAGLGAGTEWVKSRSHLEMLLELAESFCIHMWTYRLGSWEGTWLYCHIWLARSLQYVKVASDWLNWESFLIETTGESSLLAMPHKAWQGKLNITKVVFYSNFFI
jgi:hypothetical protein